MIKKPIKLDNNSHLWNILVCGEFVSGGVIKGKFSSDEFLEEINYRAISNLSEPSICIYKFIAKPNEKVLLKFQIFDIKSLAPE